VNHANTIDRDERLEDARAKYEALRFEDEPVDLTADEPTEAELDEAAAPAPAASKPWHEKAYPGGAMVKVKGFPRKLDWQESTRPGPDVTAYQRTVSRAGRWKWGEFSDDYTDEFARGVAEAADEILWSGVAGVQGQSAGAIPVSGIIGKETFNYLRSIRIPSGLDHAGEPAMDPTAVGLINDAYALFQKPKIPGPDGTSRYRLTEHFTVEEFDCNDGTKCKEREYAGLVALCTTFLEPLRTKFGGVTVNSGYRTPSYNASVGGASGSFHIYTDHDGDDQASDVTCAKGSPSAWADYLSQLRSSKRGGKGGIGRYSTFVHVDMRDYKSDWSG